MEKSNYVTIRGTKQGLILLLDDQCSFSDLILELEEKLSSKYPQLFEGPAVNVKVSLGNRFLTEQQINKIKTVIHEKQKLIIDEIDSNVISKHEAEEQKKEVQMATVAKVIRSGQVFRVQGDLLLLGDVNPGGTVMATGNIYIMGVLRGIAHAGCEGNEEAIISAAKMEPAQLRIASIVSRSPDTADQMKQDTECAYINDNNTITIERIQQLHKLRPTITNSVGAFVD